MISAWQSRIEAVLKRGRKNSSEHCPPVAIAASLILFQLIANEVLTISTLSPFPRAFFNSPRRIAISPPPSFDPFALTARNPGPYSHARWAEEAPGSAPSSRASGAWYKAAPALLRRLRRLQTPKCRSPSSTDSRCDRAGFKSSGPHGLPSSIPEKLAELDAPPRPAKHVFRAAWTSRTRSTRARGEHRRPCRPPRAFDSPPAP